MSLEFRQDAICLSGLTGSKLKCEVIGQYYPFWWGITSGGQNADYGYATAIVEMDAATGEVYIEDTAETVLGSSGHALELKCGNPNTRHLKVVLVEKDPDCFSHLKRVIKRRWSTVNIGMAEGPVQFNSSGVYLLNEPLDQALADIGRISLGNTLFFFDPLRSIEYRTIDQVALNRISSFYRVGTEFMIFLFTSDWFLGRDDFNALPTTVNEVTWSSEERRTVLEADALFGTDAWRSQILNGNLIHQREQSMVELYRNRLHKWFRYVFPMPFNPKTNQIFHLILCSNYEAGVRATRDFYSDASGNPRYSPQNETALSEFRKCHPELFVGLRRSSRPLLWRVLWSVVRNHDEGVCDSLCRDLAVLEPSQDKRQAFLEWLEKHDYVVRFTVENAWKSPIAQYRLNWPVLRDKLQIDQPPPLKPLSLKPLSMEDINR